VGQCPVYFSVKLESGIRALLQVPVKCRIIFGSGFLVKLHRISGHGAALPNYAGGLRTMKSSLPCQSPGPRDAFRSPFPRLVERPGQRCRRGWKSANPPALPVPQPRATTPALTICKLPLSFASCSPRQAYSNAAEVRWELSPPTRTPSAESSPVASHPCICRESLPACSGRRGARRLCGRGCAS
jgi:hypothetical protein